MRTALVLLTGVTICLAATTRASAHCEIPCGIYDDRLRADLIAEHAGTIEKSMKTIVSLSRKRPVNQNQLTRWISNKEAHADKIQHIVSQYFMTQRIKPDTPRYNEKIKALHELLIYAMNCKQSTDTANVDKLRAALKRFERLYFDHRHKKAKASAKGR
jgi:nickel superoxide dismutase